MIVRKIGFKLFECVSNYLNIEYKLNYKDIILGMYDCDIRYKSLFALYISLFVYSEILNSFHKIKSKYYYEVW